MKIMSAEGMSSPEQEQEGVALLLGHELFRAVRDGRIRVEQLESIESSPEQEQRDSDALDALYGEACGDCGSTNCGCLTRGY